MYLRYNHRQGYEHEQNSEGDRNVFIRLQVRVYDTHTRSLTVWSVARRHVDTHFCPSLNYEDTHALHVDEVQFEHPLSHATHVNPDG